MSVLEGYRKATSAAELEESACAVCSRWHRTKTSVLVATDDRHVKWWGLLKPHQAYLEVLRGHPWEHWPARQGTSDDILVGTMLEPQGILKDGKCSGTSQLRLCPTCHSELQASRLPSWAVVNFNWYGPQDIPGLRLTVPEEQFLCPYRVCMQVFILRPTTSQRTMPSNMLPRFCTGDCITVPHEPGKTLLAARIRSQEDFADVIKVFWVGKEKPPRDHPLLRRYFSLSLRKLRVAHAMLKAHNHLRANDLDLNFQNFEDDTVPASVYGNIELVPDEDFAVPVGPGQRPVDLDSNANNADIIRTSGVMDMDGNFGIPEKELMRHAAATYLKPEEIVVTSETDKPIVEYDNPMLWANGFLLFERALGLPDDPLRAKHGRKLTLEDWGERSMSICDHRFRLHRSFMYVLANVLLRRQVCLHAKLYVTKPSFKQHANAIDNLKSIDIPEKDMKKILQAVLSDKTSELPEGLKKLLNGIRVVGGKTSMGYFLRTSLRKRLYARNVCYGPNNIFFSGSPCETKSALVCYYHGLRNIDLDSRCPELPSPSECREIAASDPVAVLKAYLATADAFQHEVLGWERHKQAAVQTQHGGAYGRLSNSSLVNECSGRGAFHWHGLARFAGFPSPYEFQRKMQNDSEYRGKVLAFVDQIIKQGLPDASVFAMFGEQREDDASSIPDFSAFDVDSDTESTCAAPDPAAASLPNEVATATDLVETSDSDNDNTDTDRPQPADDDEEVLMGQAWTMDAWQIFVKNEAHNVREKYEPAGYHLQMTDNGEPVCTLLQCIAYVVCHNQQFHTAAEWENSKEALAHRVNAMVVERLKRDTAGAFFEGISFSSLLVSKNWKRWIQQIESSPMDNEELRLGEVPFLASVTNVFERNLVIFVPSQDKPIVIRSMYKARKAPIFLAAETTARCVLLANNEEASTNDTTSIYESDDDRDAAPDPSSTKAHQIRMRHPDTMRCPDPKDPEFLTFVKADTCGLCKGQNHRCKPTCFKYWKPGQPRVCRSRYGPKGRPLVPDTHLDESGCIVIKRTHTHINNWNPAVMLCIRCNQDIQLLLNHRDGNSVEHYLASKYVLKDYVDESVVLPILHAALKRKEQQQQRRIALPSLDPAPPQAVTAASGGPAVSPAEDRSRKLIIRVCNKLNALQTRSGCEAAMFLLKGTLLTFSDSDDAIHLAAAIGFVESAFGEKSSAYADNTVLLRSRQVSPGRRVFYTVNQYRLHIQIAKTEIHFFVFVCGYVREGAKATRK